MMQQYQRHSLQLPRATAMLATLRHVSTARFDHPPYSFRQRHTYNTMPIHDANYFGGRLAHLREIGPIDGKKRGRQFKRNKELAQYNVDVWNAQQTLRKRWKQRDWEVVELPYSLAPPVLQRVLPELYTDIPQMVDAKGSLHCDRSNIRAKTFAVEDLQPELFHGIKGDAGGALPLPYLKPNLVKRDAMTLDKFL